MHTMSETLEIYNTHWNSGRVNFLPDPISIEAQMRQYSLRPGFHVRGWADAYLTRFATHQTAAWCRLTVVSSRMQCLIF